MPSALRALRRHRRPPGRGHLSEGHPCHGHSQELRHSAFGLTSCYTSATTSTPSLQRRLYGSHGRLGRELRVLLPLYAGGQRCCPGADAQPCPAQIYDRPHPLHLRSEKSDIPFYPMDFQNDGEFVGGCIAGGRQLLPYQLGGRYGALCLYPLFRLQHPRKKHAGGSCRVRFLWPTTTASPSTTTTCAPARCWKTRTCCARSSTRPAGPQHGYAVPGDGGSPLR